jgi:transposase
MRDGSTDDVVARLDELPNLGGLSRLDEGVMCRAVTDKKRPGRPRKLSPEERTRLETTLQESPAEAGYDVPAWTPELVRRHVREAFGVEYSLPSCRRLLSEAGLRYRPRIGNVEGQRGGWVPE